MRKGGSLTPENEDRAQPQEREVETAPLVRDPDALCWCCAGPTAKRHCKIVCTNCGFMRDCSDP